MLQWEILFLTERGPKHDISKSVGLLNIAQGSLVWNSSPRFSDWGLIAATGPQVILCRKYF